MQQMHASLLHVIGCCSVYIARHFTRKSVSKVERKTLEVELSQKKQTELSAGTSTSTDALIIAAMHHIWSEDVCANQCHASASGSGQW